MSKSSVSSSLDMWERTKFPHFSLKTPQKRVGTTIFCGNSINSENTANRRKTKFESLEQSAFINRTLYVENR